MARAPLPLAAAHPPALWPESPHTRHSSGRSPCPRHRECTRAAAPPRGGRVGGSWAQILSHMPQAIALRIEVVTRGQDPIALRLCLFEALPHVAGGHRLAKHLLELCGQRDRALVLCARQLHARMIEHTMSDAPKLVTHAQPSSRG